MTSEEFIKKYREHMQIKNRIERDRKIWELQIPIIQEHGLAALSNLVKVARQEV